MHPFSVHIVGLVLGSLVLLTGCQSPGKVVDEFTSEVCPTCSTQVRTLPVFGDIRYRKHVCPSCKSVRDYGEDDEFENLYVQDIIHVCDQCKAVVEMCPLCREK